MGTKARSNPGRYASGPAVHARTVVDWAGGLVPKCKPFLELSGRKAKMGADLPRALSAAVEEHASPASGTSP